MVIRDNSHARACVEANEQLCRWGWASVRADLQTDSQPADVDIVASRDGVTVFVGVVVVNGRTSKKEVGGDIHDLMTMANIGKSFPATRDASSEWVLLVKMAHTGEWFAIESKVPYVKGAEEYRTMKSVMA